MKKNYYKTWSFYLLLVIFFFIGTTTINAFTTDGTYIYCETPNNMVDVYNNSNHSRSNGAYGSWITTWDYICLPNGRIASLISEDPTNRNTDIARLDYTISNIFPTYQLREYASTSLPSNFNTETGFNLVSIATSSSSLESYTNPLSFHFINITNPIGNLGATSTSYNFTVNIPINFSYFTNEETWGSMRIFNINTNQTEQGLTIYTNTATGTINYNATTTLQQGSTTKNYRLDIYINGATSTIATSTTFSILGNTGYKPNDFNFIDSTIGTTTLPDATNFLSFLNVPELLKTKIPFGYIYQINGIIQNAIASSTNTNIGTLSYTIKIGNATSTYSIFSSSTIKYFFTQDKITLFRNLEIMFLWFGLAWFLYHDAKNKQLF